MHLVMMIMTPLSGQGLPAPCIYVYSMCLCLYVHVCVCMYVCLPFLKRPALVGNSASVGTSGVHLRQRLAVGDDKEMKGFLCLSTKYRLCVCVC